MDGISPAQLIGSLILSGVGGYIGVRVAVVQLQERMKNAQDEIKILRKRTHKHSTLITIMASRLGIHTDPSSITDELEV